MVTILWFDCYGYVIIARALMWCFTSIRHVCATKVRIIALLSPTPWWRHQMETFFGVTVLLCAFCAGNSPVTGKFLAQRPVTRSFDASFDLRLNIRLSQQSWGWWFETLSRSLWSHRDDIYKIDGKHTTTVHTKAWTLAIMYAKYCAMEDEVHIKQNNHKW